MNYKNGEAVLPYKLLLELQKYVQGELIYIPRPGKSRAGWGEANGTRAVISSRNRDIYMKYKNGSSILSLADHYHLTEDSIRKILLKEKNNQNKCSDI